MSEQQYRMLAAGEILQEGDEFYNDHDDVWIPTQRVGGAINASGRYRRPVVQEQKPTLNVISETVDNGLRYFPVTTDTTLHVDFRNRNAAIDELVRKVFGAEPVYDGSMSQEETMKALVEEDIAHQDMTALPAEAKCLEGSLENPQKFVDPHGVFVVPKSEIPDGLPPLPPVPEGYDRWEYRGVGWESERTCRFAFSYEGDSDGWLVKHMESAGLPNLHYIEAVKDTTPPPPANPTRDEILQNLDRIINQGADSDVRSGYYPDALWLEEARQMIFKLEQDRRRLHSSLTHASYHITRTPLCYNIKSLLKSIKP